MKTICLLLFLGMFYLWGADPARANEPKIQVIPWEGMTVPDLEPQVNTPHLTFKGGLEITAPSSFSLGGFSAALTSAAGDTLWCFSDFSSSNHFPTKYRSCFYQFKVEFTANQALADLRLIHSGQMLDANDTPIPGELESVARIDSTLYVSFDNQRNRGAQVWSFDWPANIHEHLPKAKTSSFRVDGYPPEKENEGIECMTETHDGRLFLIHETLPGQRPNSQRHAWIVNPANGFVQQSMYTSRLQEVKGATTLHNGNLVVLEKTFDRNSGSTRINLVHVSLGSLSHSSIYGRLLLDAESTLFDNFEGIASFRRNGKSYLLLVSDNNGDWNLTPVGMPNQKNILLLFELKKDL